MNVMDIVCRYNKTASEQTHDYIVISHQLKLTAARLKKGTAQWFRLANSGRIFFNLSWYDYIC